MVWALTRSLATTCVIIIYFLLLRLLRCFSSPGLLSLRSDMSSTCRVAPFRNLRINSYLPIPEAYRSLSRLSSPLKAKASSIRPYLLSFFVSNVIKYLREHGYAAFAPHTKDVCFLSWFLSTFYYRLDYLKSICCRPFHFAMKMALVSFYQYVNERLKLDFRSLKFEALTLLNSSFLILPSQWWRITDSNR